MHLWLTGPQVPELHWLSFVQSVPLDNLGTQAVPPLQYKPMLAQLDDVSGVQLVTHAGPPAPCTHASEAAHVVMVCLHEPSVAWHASLMIVPAPHTVAAQLIGVPDPHTPAAVHFSAPLQMSPSEQLVPTGFGACVHVPAGPHASSVHAFKSSHSPAPVHTLQFGIGTCFGPTTASQLSVVQGSMSS